MEIVLTGSIAFDYLMKFPGYFKDHILPDQLECLSLSFLVESMVREPGGIAPNIAYTLALLGEHPRLFATAGEDFAEYRQEMESYGVDTSGIRLLKGEFTASFFANTDQANAQIASFYPGAMSAAADLSLEELGGERPELVMISPNDPRAMVRYVLECKKLKIPYIYDPSQQIPRLTDEEIEEGINGALALFVNEYESKMIQKRTGLTITDINRQTQFMVVTLGADGSIVYQGKDETRVPVVPPQQIADPTGVGDAFRGGFLSGYAQGWDLETCARMGSVAAAYCLEQDGPRGHSFTPRELVARYRQHFDDQGLLDIFLNS
jgi:adenosine kinase